MKEEDKLFIGLRSPSEIELDEVEKIMKILVRHSEEVSKQCSIITELDDVKFGMIEGMMRFLQKIILSLSDESKLNVSLERCEIFLKKY